MLPDTYPSFSLSSVSWSAVIAGAVVACATTLFLLVFGMGVGFLVVSPWSDQGVSSTTFAWSAALYLIAVSMIASTIGGYLAGRLRSRWSVDPDETYFRDSAHGVLTWALALILGAVALGSATTSILSGASAGIGPAAAVAGTNESPVVAGYVDRLFQTDRPAPQAGANDMEFARAEASRVFIRGLQPRSEITAADRTQLARAVSARTGLPQAEAERRVTEVTTQAKQATDEARKAAAKLSLWLAASMLAGALAAGLAAIEGGSLRDRVRVVEVRETATTATVPVR